MLSARLASNDSGYKKENRMNQRNWTLIIVLAYLSAGRCFQARTAKSSKFTTIGLDGQQRLAFCMQKKGGWWMRASAKVRWLTELFSGVRPHLSLEAILVVGVVRVRSWTESDVLVTGKNCPNSLGIAACSNFEQGPGVHYHHPHPLLDWLLQLLNFC